MNRPSPRVTEELPSDLDRTRIKPSAPVRPGALGLEERVALFAHALMKDAAAPLLEGFAKGKRKRSVAYFQALSRAPSAERQGRLASEFGTRLDSPERMRAVWAEASPELKGEIFRRLPSYLRTLFPQF